MYKLFLISFLLFTSSRAFAQATQPIFQKDSAKIFKSKLSVSTYDEIKAGLKAILDKYKNASNDKTTWAKIKLEAENYLYSYFKDGKLAGKITSQAYFVQMDLQTMTMQDIETGKKILVAGIAIIKPSEFSVIRIESGNF